MIYSFFTLKSGNKEPRQGPKGHWALEVHGEHISEVRLHGAGDVPDHHDHQPQHGVCPWKLVHREVRVHRVLLGRGQVSYRSRIFTNGQHSFPLSPL